VSNFGKIAGFVKIHLEVLELLHADRQTDMAKILDAFFWSFNVRRRLKTTGGMKENKIKGRRTHKRKGKGRREDRKR
jgi:hypothetical protein